MGAVSACGTGTEALWLALTKGMRPEALLEPPQEGAQPILTLMVRGWSPADLLGKRGLQYLRPSAKFLAGASLLALQEAGLAHLETGVAQLKAEPDALGIVIGSNLVGLQSITNYDRTAIQEGPQYVSPMEAPNTLANAPASHLAIRLKARAFNTTIATGQCAGLDALGYAKKMLDEGRARQVVVGGVEELSAAALWVYRNMGVLPTERVEDAGRPFHAQSTGWLPSEGAAVLVLERASAALARGVRPLAEFGGWSSTFAPSTTIEKRATAITRAASQAVHAVGSDVEHIAAVVAGANGLQVQDQAEAHALRALLADNDRVAITAIKGTLGEAYGASGLFQALAATHMFDRGLVPPTFGHASIPSLSGLNTEARAWPGSKRDLIVLLAQDLFGSTSAVVLRRSA